MMVHIKVSCFIVIILLIQINALEQVFHRTGPDGSYNEVRRSQSSSPDGSVRYSTITRRVVESPRKIIPFRRLESSSSPWKRLHSSAFPKPLHFDPLSQFETIRSFGPSLSQYPLPEGADSYTPPFGRRVSYKANKIPDLKSIRLNNYERIFSRSWPQNSKETLPLNWGRKWGQPLNDEEDFSSQFNLRKSPQLLNNWFKKDQEPPEEMSNDDPSSQYNLRKSPQLLKNWFEKGQQLPEEMSNNDIPPQYNLRKSPQVLNNWFEKEQEPQDEVSNDDFSPPYSLRKSPPILNNWDEKRQESPEEMSNDDLSPPYSLRKSPSILNNWDEKTQESPEEISNDDLPPQVDLRKFHKPSSNWYED